MDNRLQPQFEWQVRHIGEAHLRNREYLTKPILASQSEDRSYSSSEQFWTDILSGKLRSSFVVSLSNLRLFEWFPRSPGLYHTGKAAYAREEALRHIDYGFPDRSDVTRDHANPLRRITPAGDSDDRLIVFTPAGKQSMLEGGIGCIRLKPIQFPDGIFWFMSASSTESPDQGIPVAIADEDYGRVIETIQNCGYCICNLVGRIKFVGQDGPRLYPSFGGVPQIYVQIESLEPQRTEKIGADVSVAVSFKGNVEGRVGIYAAYVTFDPSQMHSKSDAIEWLKSKYVEGRYAGTIVTDFDQQANIFSRTLFSLDAVMARNDLTDVFQMLMADNTLAPLVGAGRLNLMINYGKVTMSKYNISNSTNTNIIDQSPGATISVSQLPKPADVDIRKELSELRDILLTLSVGDRHQNLEAALTEAVNEAERPNPDRDVIGNATDRALKFAKKADDFSERLEHVVPRIMQIAGWLGNNWYKILSLVGTAVAGI
jgi:hypothetical protein